MKIIKFQDETWDFTVHLLVPATAEQTKAYVRDVFGGDDGDPGCFHAIAFTGLENAVIALEKPFKRTPDGISLLAHEVFHVASQSLMLREIPLNKDTQEAFAYLLGSLMRRCLERLL